MRSKEIKKRQRIRQSILIISFLLFPITIYYFSPYLIIWGAINGIVVGSFVIFFLQLVSGFVVGRGFCGWICPLAGLQEWCFAVNNKPVNRKYGWIKWIIWIPWFTSIVILFVIAGGFLKFDFFFQTTKGISVANLIAYIPYLAILILTIIITFTCGKRAFCHYVCWMPQFMIIGKKISKFVGLQGLYLKVDKRKCKNCKLCDSQCVMSLSINEMVQNDMMENNDCILCGKCVDSCSKDTIRYSFRIFSHRL